MTEISTKFDNYGVVTSKSSRIRIHIGHEAGSPEYGGMSIPGRSTSTPSEACLSAKGFISEASSDVGGSLVLFLYSESVLLSDCYSMVWCVLYLIWHMDSIV